MDEAEALCDKIAIMINGKILVYSSPQKLKENYGQGYMLKVKVTKSDEAQGKADQLIMENMPYCRKINNKAINSLQIEIEYQID